MLAAPVWVEALAVIAAAFPAIVAAVAVIAEVAAEVVAAVVAAVVAEVQQPATPSMRHQAGLSLSVAELGGAFELIDAAASLQVQHMKALED